MWEIRCRFFLDVNVKFEPENQKKLEDNIEKSPNFLLREFHLNENFYRQFIDLISPALGLSFICYF